MIRIKSLIIMVFILSTISALLLQAQDVPDEVFDILLGKQVNIV